MPTREKSLRRQARLAALVKALPAPDRGRLLALADQSEVKLAAMIRDAISVLKDEMVADRVVRVVVLDGKGQSHIESFTEPDWATRHRGADGALSLAGVYPSKTAGGNGPVAAAKVEITLRRDHEPEVVSVVEVPVTPAK